MEGFDWSAISLGFPEWANDENGKREESLWKDFPSSPNFRNGSVQFLWKEDYGISLHFTPIPSWLSNEAIIGGKPLEVFYRESSRELQEKVLEDLENSFEIFESWRERGLIQRYINNEHKGRITNHLDFKKECGDISLFDYYNLETKMNEYSISPTDKIIKIGRLPRESLNSQWSKYAELSKIVRGNANPGSCNSIIGSTISECVERADKVYSLAPELRGLKI